MRNIVSLCGVFVFAAAATAAEPSVKVTKVEETRIAGLVEGKFPSSDGLEVGVHVSGTDADSASQYGKVKITKAVDDTGRDLNKREGGPVFIMDETSYRKIDREAMMNMASFGLRPGEKPPKLEGFDFSIHLPQVSDRKAKSITELTGEFEMIAGGEEKVVEVKDILAQIGKPLEDPALKEAGITITFLDPANRDHFSSGPNSLTAGGIL